MFSRNEYLIREKNKAERLLGRVNDLINELISYRAQAILDK